MTKKGILSIKLGLTLLLCPFSAEASKCLSLFTTNQTSQSQISLSQFAIEPHFDPKTHTHQLTYVQGLAFYIIEYYETFCKSGLREAGQYHSVISRHRQLLGDTLQTPDLAGRLALVQLYAMSSKEFELLGGQYERLLSRPMALDFEKISDLEGEIHQLADLLRYGVRSMLDLPLMPEFFEVQKIERLNTELESLGIPLRYQPKSDDGKIYFLREI